AEIGQLLVPEDRTQHIHVTHYVAGSEIGQHALTVFGPLRTLLGELASALLLLLHPFRSAIGLAVVGTLGIPFLIGEALHPRFARTDATWIEPDEIESLLQLGIPDRIHQRSRGSHT